MEKRLISYEEYLDLTDVKFNAINLADKIMRLYGQTYRWILVDKKRLNQATEAEIADLEKELKENTSVMDLTNLNNFMQIVNAAVNAFGGKEQDWIKAEYYDANPALHDFYKGVNAQMLKDYVLTRIAVMTNILPMDVVFKLEAYEDFEMHDKKISFYKAVKMDVLDDIRFYSKDEIFNQLFKMEQNIIEKWLEILDRQGLMDIELKGKEWEVLRRAIFSYALLSDRLRDKYGKDELLSQIENVGATNKYLINSYLKSFLPYLESKLAN